MGSCFGKCWCSCCDCVVIKKSGEAIQRRANRNKSQTYNLRRQSSTIEFENLIFEFDIPEPSQPMLQLHPKSVSSWLAMKEDSTKEPSFKETKEVTPYFEQDIAVKNESHEYAMRTMKKQSELPLVDPLLRKAIEERKLCERRGDTPPDRVSTGGSSEAGELQWEHEVNSDDLSASHGNELEWDHYDEDNLGYNTETEQLIHEIEEMTKRTLNA